MSTFISEPGTRLGGRYRLEDRTAAAGGWAAWKAIDEILARPVTVVTFEPGFPRVRETVTAARAASRLTDARLTQVFDVEDDWDHAYIVMEWAAGDSLDDLLAAGPIDPGRGGADRRRGRRGAVGRARRRARAPLPAARVAAVDPEQRREDRRPGRGRRADRDHLRGPGGGRHPRPGQPAVRGADRALAGPGLPVPAARAGRRRAGPAAPADHRGRPGGARRHHLPGPVPAGPARGSRAEHARRAGRGADRGDPAGPAAGGRAAAADPRLPGRCLPGQRLPGGHRARPHRLRAVQPAARRLGHPAARPASRPPAALAQSHRDRDGAGVRGDRGDHHRDDDACTGPTRTAICPARCRRRPARPPRPPRC